MILPTPSRRETRRRIDSMREGDCCDQDVYYDSRVQRVTRMPLLAVGPFGLSENHGATERAA